MKIDGKNIADWGLRVIKYKGILKPTLEKGTHRL